MMEQGLRIVIQCEQGAYGRLYHQSHDTMDSSGKLSLSSIHTSNTVYHDDSLENAIHVRCVIH